MQTPFFAHADDLRLLLDDVESRRRLKYVRGGLKSNGGGEVFGSAAELHALGKATADSSGASWFLLICDESGTVAPRVVGRSGEVFDQLLNPDTIELSPGGIWKDGILIGGHVCTASDSAASKALMKLFRSAISKHFTRVKAYAVGPSALISLKSGWRLTDAVQSPTTYDLSTD